jgi:hypothetical protein
MYSLICNQHVECSDSFLCSIITVIRLFLMGQDSIVGTVTRYRLEGPGIKSWWGQDFAHLSRLAHPPFCRMGPISLSRRGKAAGM